MLLHENINENGFAIVENVFSETEITEILKEIELNEIESTEQQTNNLTKQVNVFGIRCFLQEIPKLKKRILIHQKLTNLLNSFNHNYKLVKSIFFNKPLHANWVVNWHQDLTINLKQKSAQEDFKHWVSKDNYFSVQPPIKYLQNIITVRIHLDDCFSTNGALKVIPKSHQEIQRMTNLPQHFFETETTCEVSKGGILLMKPLLWHSSRRSENQQNRRVIHLEFCSLELPPELEWQENE